MLAKHLFCKNGFAKGKNKHTITVVQDHFLFAWLYYSTKFYFINRLFKKILSFCRINFSIRRKLHSKAENMRFCAEHRVCKSACRS